MPAAMTLISSQTLGSAVASVTFGSGGTLTQAYRDLYLVVNGSGTGGNGILGLRMNGDTSTSNYTDVAMYGDGSTAGSESHSTLGYIKQSISNFTSNEAVIVQVFDYSATDKHKTTITRENSQGAGYGAYAVAGRWASTSAVTSITLMHSGTNTFAAGCTFFLYGVSA